MARAPFITIYGINNIGKTTQVEKLVAHLNSLGYKAEHIKYPIYDSPTGRRINDILRGGEELTISEEEFQLLFVKNREDFDPTLVQKLESGIIIVAEDYIGTGIAWGRSKGVDYDWSKRANAHLRREDLAVLMDGERFLEAQEKGHRHEEDDDRVTYVRAQLLVQARDFGYRIVNVNQSIDDVFDDILDCVRRYTDLQV